MSELVYIALGSNLGDRARYLQRGRDAIAALPETRIIAETSVEQTEPIGPLGQGAYLNQMIAVETAFEPHELLRQLQSIEAANGRERRERWGPRTLDLDVVKYGDTRLETRDLVLPHPQLHNRDFWQREIEELNVQLAQIGAL